MGCRRSSVPGSIAATLATGHADARWSMMPSRFDACRRFGVLMICLHGFRQLRPKAIVVAAGAFHLPRNAPGGSGSDH